MQTESCARPVYVTVGQMLPGELLAGKRVVVTGGGSGIGKEIARAAVKQGASVLITGRNGEKLEKAAAELNEQKQSVSCLAWDICDFADMPGVLQKAETLLGGEIDCWVNNAGIYPGGYSFRNTTEAVWDRVFDINLKATCFVSNAVANYLIEKGNGGSLLFVSSETGSCAYTNPYGMSKAALNSYIKGLAYELVRYGIRSNGVAPGITVSDINPRDTAGDLHAEPIIGRMLLPEEIAQTAIFLLSDLSKCINGEIILCNGGNCIPVESFR